MNEEQKRQVAIFRLGVIHGIVGGVRLEWGEQQWLLRGKRGRKWSIPLLQETVDPKYRLMVDKNVYENQQ